MDSLLEKRLKILEKAVNILDSIANDAFKDHFIRPGSMEPYMFLRETNARKCAELYSRISKNSVKEA